MRHANAALVLLGLLSVGCAQAPPSEGTVAHVLDGDTVRLDSGQVIRYLGIDTPEVRRQVRGVWYYDPEPFAQEATLRNRALVEGKRVRLEYDQRLRDRYHRLLAYVFVEDLCVNEQLLREGLAKLFIWEPNTYYAMRLTQAAQQARRERRGLWRK